jgi:ribonuclease HII
MHLALEQLQKSPEYIVVDGNKFFSFNEIPHQCIVKGDGKFQNIAAASVLAKTYRDDYMKKINADFPVYGWDQNKGYPTQSHRAAIQKYGSTPHHRKSFQLLPRQLEIDF